MLSIFRIRERHDLLSTHYMHIGKVSACQHSRIYNIDSSSVSVWDSSFLYVSNTHWQSCILQLLGTEIKYCILED